MSRWEHHLLRQEEYLQSRVSGRKTMPFTIHLETTKARKILEIANEKYVVPDDIDECNDEIAEI